MAGFLMNVGKAGEVAERSPTVISANMKEDMLLQKKLIVLNRSERGLVHQIKVDQKVLYKRFQARLVRSKLGFARIMGQKDVEKELRSKNLCGLNTDIVGNSDEDYTFLEKLDTRPCTASSYSPCISVPPRSTTPRKQSANSSRTNTPAIKSSLRMRPSARASSATVRSTIDEMNKKDDTEVDQEQEDVIRGDMIKELRPATTTGTRVEEEHFNGQKEISESLKSESTTSQKSTPRPNEDANIEKATVDNNSHDEFSETDKYVNKPGLEGSQDASGDKNEETQAVEETEEETEDQKPTVAFLEQLEIPFQRPRTVAAVGIPDESPPISPKQYSRRASKAADFFQEEKKIDLVELRLKAARAVDHTEQVEKFCKDLEDMECSVNRPNVDYYVLRLEASMKQGMVKTIQKVPGTPDEENKRAMGNIYVRSLTFPKIDWNFEGS